MRSPASTCARTHTARLLWILTLLHNPLVLAQSANATRAVSAEDILPLTNDPNDPIGIDREQATLEHAAPSGNAPKPMRRDSAEFGPEPGAIAARSGEVLAALPSVHEQSHRVSVELANGLAYVTAELTFENSADKPAELQYRWAVPDDAALASLEVCTPRGCRKGLPDARGGALSAYDDAVQARGPKGSAGQLPAAHAQKLRDARGSALLLRAAPVQKSGTLRVRVTYLARAAQHAGIVRFNLPARGMDPRVAPLELTLRGKNLSELRANDAPADATPLRADPWAAVEIRATAAGSSNTSQLWKASCGGHPCLHAYVAAPSAQPRAADIVLAFDASPSTEGSARSRLLATAAAILAQAPNGSRVRALRFASQALPLLAARKEPRELSLTAFGAVAFEAELGAATRFEAAWQLIEKWGFAKGAQRKLVVVIGDGGITTGPARPFEAARKAGVEVAVVNVADRTTQPALAERALSTGGAVIDAGSEADATLRGAPPDRLEERVAAIFQPSAGQVRVSGARGVPSLLGLRAGDSLSIEAACAGNCSVQLGGRALAATTAPATLAAGIALHTAQLLGSPDPRGNLSAVEPADLGKNGDRPANQLLPAKKGLDCDRRGPTQRSSGLSSDAAPVALAVERAVCALPPLPAKPRDPDDEVGAGMPGSPLLSMLRQRIIPVARGCFRRDRAGRADYQVRALFVFELAEREVISAQIQGKIPDELRTCLLAAVDTLAVPRFAGRVVVRYPLVTEREVLPAQIELTAQTAGRLDSVLGNP